jgi:hypothetical protein
MCQADGLIHKSNSSNLGQDSFTSAYNKSEKEKSDEMLWQG